MKASMKKVPEFKTEQEEREFWAAYDSADYINWSEAQAERFPKLKPATKSISIRLPQAIIEDLKKVFLAERIDAEFNRKKAG